MDKEYWIFTFGDGHMYYGYYVKIYGSYAEARRKMAAKYGTKWAFQYSKEQWDEWLDTKPWYFKNEEELEVIE